jgi:flagellar assembly protein FliH
MAEAIKFTFDEMFDTAEANSNQPDQARAQVKKVRWTEEEIEEIKATAREEGVAEAMAASETKLAEANAASLEAIATAASNSLSQLAEAENSARADAASLALSIARKLSDVLITRFPQVEIESVIRECLTHLNREPRLVVRVNNTLASQIETTIQQDAQERGMTDKIMIVGVETIEPGDCEIEWSDGGVSRNRADLDRQAAEIIERYIETLTDGADQVANEENNHG